MKQLLAIATVLVVIAAACGGDADSPTDVAATSDADDSSGEATPDEATPDEEPAAEDPTDSAAEQATEATPTEPPVSEPVEVNAIAIGLDPEPQFDFTGQPSPDADLNATLIVGSPLKAVVTSMRGFAPGCFGLTVWDPDFVTLVEGYWPTSPGGCTAMAPPVEFTESQMLVVTPTLMVIDLGEMPSGPYILSYQLADEGGGSGSYRNQPQMPQSPDDILDISGFDYVVGPTGPIHHVESGRWDPYGLDKESASGGACVADNETLCLDGDRFAVTVDWTDSSGSGSGMVFGEAGDSGQFWFFDPDNVELLVRVLNGCEINQTFWVFAAATTDVEYTLTVTDTETATTFDYSNPLGQPSPAIIDTQAFATCP